MSEWITRLAILTLSITTIILTTMWAITPGVLNIKFFWTFLSYAALLYLTHDIFVWEDDTP